eukprot:Opistho-2@71328
MAGNSTTGSSEDTEHKFVVSFVLNTSVSLLCVLIFCIARTRSPRFFSPRSLGVGADVLPAPPGFVAWILPTLRVNTMWLLRHRGLDAAMYVRFQRKMAFTFGLLALLVLVTLIPINGSGEMSNLPSDNPAYVSGLNVISLANLAPGSDKLWAASVMGSLFLVIMWIALYREYGRYCQLRNEMRDAPTIEQYSIVTHNYPFKSRQLEVAEQEEDVRSFFDSMFPGAIVRAVPVPDCKQLSSLRRKENKICRDLEIANIRFEKKGTRPTLTVDPRGDKKKVDKIDHLAEELRRTVKEIDEAQALYVKGSPVQTGTAIVTFNSALTAAACAQAQISDNPWVCHVTEAPEPNDVFWNNLGTPLWRRLIGSVLMYTCMFFLIFFWSVPVTFIQGLANLSQLSQKDHFHWVKVFLDIPVVTAFIEGYLPALLLLFVTNLVLPFIRWVSTLQARTSHSEQEASVLVKYLAFLIVNVFLVSVVAGSIFNRLEQLIDSPISIVNTLVQSIPAQGYFFIQYVMVSAAGAWVDLIKPIDLLSYWFNIAFRCRTPTDYAKAQRRRFDYAEAYGNDLLISMISLTYSVLFPFILVFTAAYFLARWFVALYNFTYVHSKPFEGYGRMFRNSFGASCVSQCVMVVGTLETIGGGQVDCRSIFLVSMSTQYLVDCIRLFCVIRVVSAAT